jgi:hypothetical protein
MVRSPVVETAPGQETVPQTEAERSYVHSQKSLVWEVVPKEAKASVNE